MDRRKGTDVKAIRTKRHKAHFLICGTESKNLKKSVRVTHRAEKLLSTSSEKQAREEPVSRAYGHSHSEGRLCSDLDSREA